MITKSGPSADGTVTLDVSLLGREYKVACKESERSELLDAVALLDRRMREIRDTRKIAGSERIAVMAALNIAHELIDLKQKNMNEGSTVAQHVQMLKHKLEGVLSASVK